MSSQKQIEQIRGPIEAILTQNGMELVLLMFRQQPAGWTLQVFIDKEGGVTVGDCASMSEEISQFLDVENFFRQKYRLEVSSPGLNRPLSKEKDFGRFAGSKVRLRTTLPVENQKNFRGRLLGLQEGNVLLEIDGKTVEIVFSNIAQANIEYEFDAPCESKEKVDRE
jgi:ribosome maturation factor RimP